MLSNIDIENAVKSGEIKIVPFEKKLLEPNSIYFRLDNKIAVPKNGTVDLENEENFSKFFDEKIVEEVVLKPGDFILARTLEQVSISNKYSMLIEGRSTLGRLGVSVVQTAMTVESGHGTPTPRKIVLEIKNNGPFIIRLLPGMKIAKGIFFKLNTPTTIPYDEYFKYGADPERIVPLP